MQVYFSLTEVPKAKRAVSIGVIDGVHLGHRVLLRRLVGLAHQHRLQSLVFTFANHPTTVLNPPAPPLLTTADEKLALLSETGIDEVLILPFTEELSRYSAERFCSEILVDALGCRLLVVGHDFALGYKREGTVQHLRELGTQLSFDVGVVDAVTNEGELISSSHIRNLLLKGELKRANELLGKPYRLSGIVTSGARRGRQLGFPTINLSVPAEKLLPSYGVYAGQAHLPTGTFNAASYIGIRPTFGETVPVVEAHLLEFEGTVTKKTPATLELLAFIRPDKRFESVNELIGQIQRDVEAVRKILDAFV